MPKSKPSTVIESKPVVEAHVKRQPMYHVILHNDDDHSYNYVISMLMKLFGKTEQQAFKHAEQVNNAGLSIVETTTMERAELKRDQIHAFGRDPHIPKCQGSMSATIEPSE